jgi:hypothetical protein
VVQPNSFTAHGKKLWNIPDELHFDGVGPTTNGVTLVSLFAFAIAVTVEVTINLVLRYIRADFSKLDQPIMDFLLGHSVLTAFDLDPGKPLIGVGLWTDIVVDLLLPDSTYLT